MDYRFCEPGSHWSCVHKLRSAEAINDFFGDICRRLRLAGCTVFCKYRLNCAALYKEDPSTNSQLEGEARIGNEIFAISWKDFSPTDGSFECLEATVGNGIYRLRTAHIPMILSSPEKEVVTVGRDLGTYFDGLRPNDQQTERFASWFGEAIAPYLSEEGLHRDDFPPEIFPRHYWCAEMVLKDDGRIFFSNVCKMAASGDLASGPWNVSAFPKAKVATPPPPEAWQKLQPDIHKALESFLMQLSDAQQDANE